jgi:hypothetical protein
MHNLTKAVIATVYLLTKWILLGTVLGGYMYGWIVFAYYTNETFQIMHYVMKQLAAVNFMMSHISYLGISLGVGLILSLNLMIPLCRKVIPTAVDETQFIFGKWNEYLYPK